MRFFIFMAFFIDLTGHTYGKLTVIGLHCGGYYTVTTWDCKCECGNTTVVRGHKLRGGHTQSCGCLKREGRKRIDLVGMKFNKLTVTSLHSKDYRHLRWNCICDCGNITSVLGYNLKNGAVKSCGCLAKTNPNNKTHGLSNTRLANILDNMKGRCYRKNNNAYHYYGARGIKICDAWLADTNNFYVWAMENGYDDSLTIERINNDGNYEPSNCRWATFLDQSQNKTTTVGKENVLIIRELLKTKTPKEIAEIYNTHIDTIKNIKHRRSYKNI